ncbi:MAG: ATP-binding cassette domain-containing protein [Gammaproteobacteria bacterium]|nr:ATP-binding cassette domain-containing protein [Gammaproteobacteria bacterium]
MMSNNLSLKFNFSYHGHSVINIDLEIPMEGITAITGVSGIGKSTLLKCISGLKNPQKGRIVFKDLIWFDSEKEQSIPVENRNIGFVFQSNNLLKHLTVQENIKYLTKRSNQDLSESEIDSLSNVLDCTHLFSKRVHELSGGEQQRVALLKVFVSDPKLILLDEPLSALDTRARNQLLNVITQYQKKNKVPILWVTHSMIEVQQCADQVVCLKRHQVDYFNSTESYLSSYQVETPLEGNLGVSLLGLFEEYLSDYGLLRTSTSLGELLVPIEKKQLESQIVTDTKSDEYSKNINVAILATNVSISLEKEFGSSILNQWFVEIADIQSQTDCSKVVIVMRKNGQILYSEITAYSLNRLNLEIGQMVWAKIKSVSVY